VYSRITSTNAPSLFVIAFSTSLTNLAVIVPQ
jgi:hypothetical protein